MNQNRTVIGKVSVSEKSPATSEYFEFWLRDHIRVNPSDVVLVVNDDNSISYGIVEDIVHITDSINHLGNYISSNFGDVTIKPRTQKLSVKFAKVSVIHNSKGNFMPVNDGSLVYAAQAEDVKVALGLDAISEKESIPAGLMYVGGQPIGISFNSKFLIGPEGAHLNISGISGLATKTSYIMFLLKALQEKYKDDVSIIILNVKGDDLLHLHLPNTLITEKQKKDWDILGIPKEPFQNVKYFYPYKRGVKHSGTFLPIEDLQNQEQKEIVKNFVYTFEHDKDKLDLLFSNVDDPNQTIDSILNTILTDSEFDNLDWDDFKQKLSDYTAKGSGKNKKSEILVQSWRRFKRLINNSINDDLFVNAKSGNKALNQTFVSDEIMNLEGGEVLVFDIATLTENLQCLVFGDIIKSVYALKHGDYEENERSVKGDIPKRIIIFVDELNKYAPSTSGNKHTPLMSNLLEITERGRSEGIVLFSAEQFRSAVHDRIKGNSGTNVYGRTNALEISRSDYKFIPQNFKNVMTRLKKGELILQHPIYNAPIKVQFPFPIYAQGGAADE